MFEEVMIQIGRKLVMLMMREAKSKKPMKGCKSNSARRGTGKAEDAKSQSRQKPHKPAKSRTSQNATCRRGTGNAEDAKSQRQNCHQKPHKPTRSRKAKKPRNQKAKKPRSRKAKKPRSQEAKKRTRSHGLWLLLRCVGLGLLHTFMAIRMFLIAGSTREAKQDVASLN